MPHGTLCYGQPINRAHPLNRGPGGLIAQWLVVPWYKSGPRWIELANRQHATLAAATAAPSWDGFAPPGGFGCLKFDGSNDAASAAINLSAYNQLTIAWWMYWDAFANNDKLAFEYTANYNGTNGGFICDPNESGSGTFQFAVKNTSGVAEGRFTRPSALVWHRYVIVVDLTVTTNCVAAIYLDGVSQSLTRAVNNNASGVFANSSLYFMSRNAANLFGAGRLAELSLHGRLWSANEAAVDYEEARRGYPERLNWLTNRAWLFAPVSAAAGRISRAGALEGLGGAGQMAFNPSLSGV